MREPKPRDIVEISAGQEACEAEQRTTDLKIVPAAYPINGSLKLRHKTRP